MRTNRGFFILLAVAGSRVKDEHVNCLYRCRAANAWHTLYDVQREI